MDEMWMRKAIMLAKHAQKQGEVPVGAILVYKNEVIGQGWNKMIHTNNPTAHAEMIALQQGGLTLRNYRLLNTCLYVTLEPCAMCAAAMIHGRIHRLIYGASDPKSGAIISQLELLNFPKMNHKIIVTAGVLEQECGTMLTNFFQKRRKQQRLIRNII